ncbi:late control protein D [Ruegeria marisrubri]|uniref:phage late control D family protein n=1 Tax=Ruegeria marisrubri TaxID=1685379 RepID=UPI001CD3D686|nr:contractile injection system protein, VgrG/Pvc8 family [Ruegeria marisrubri]MCA0905119.1 late control protein D [Ruegeria marisrubri]
MGLIDFRPLLRVMVNGLPLSNSVFSQVSSVSVTDEAGFVSDVATVEFANVTVASYFTMPKPGAEIEIALGYLGQFKSMGLFVADEVEESSPPRKILVTARAKAHGESDKGLAPILQQKTRSWPSGMTLKALAETIASENKLKAAVTDAAAGLVLAHIDQIDESDMSVLTRIAVMHDLVAKPAGGSLFVGRKGDARKASGGATPNIALREQDVSSWAMRRTLGEVAGTVIATYRDLSAKQDKEIKVGDKEPVRRLRQRFRSETEARIVAESEARRASRAKETLELEMPGNPSIVAEGKIRPVGFSSAAAGEWLVKSVTHSLSDAGFLTSLRAERPE